MPRDTQQSVGTPRAGMSGGTTNATGGRLDKAGRNTQEPIEMQEGSRHNTRALEGSFAAILLTYLVATSAFSEGFARLSLDVGGVPLFVGEATIASLLILQGLILVRTRRLPFRMGVAEAGLLAFLLLGGIYVVQGLLRGYGVAAFRDFALVYYLLFYFFVLAYPGQDEGKVTILRAIVFGGVLSAFIYGGRFLVSPGLNWEHAAGGNQGLLAWVAAAYLVLSRSAGEKPVVGIGRMAAILACTFLIYLSAVRTLLGSVLASLAALWLWKMLRRGRHEPGSLKNLSALTAGVAIAFLLVVAHANLLTPSQEPIPINGPVPLSDALQVLSTRWVRGFYGRSATPLSSGEGLGEGLIETSLAFRAMVWQNAADRILSSPWTGIGFGPAPALFDDSYCQRPYSATSNCGNAHNTYLTLAMRMGIPVLALLLAITGAIVGRLILSGTRPDGIRPPQFVAETLLVVLASFSVYAFMNLFLESPYLSSLFWVALALVRSREPAVPGSGERSRAKAH